MSRALVFLIIALLAVLIGRDEGVVAQSSLAALSELRDATMARLPTASPATLERAAQAPVRRSITGGLGGQLDAAQSCPTREGNPLSSLVATEDNPMAGRFEGFVARDRRGWRSRPWRSHRRAERARRGVDIQRPLLVFLETPKERQDATKPWFGPVRFDRPGFPTTKKKIVEQVFGKHFDHRDPASVAGFYYRESGGKLIVSGDERSVHTVLVPYITFNSAPMVEAILAQLDPILDFRKRADEYGWVDPIFIMTPFSISIDTYDPALMGGLYLGYGPSVYDIAPALTDDVYPDGTHAALSTLAISMVGYGFGSETNPKDIWFGLTEEQTRSDHVALYAHEYGHAIGLSHMMTMDYALDADSADRISMLTRFEPSALNRAWGTGYATTIMNYAYGSGRGPNQLPLDGRQWAGLDPINRSKLGWGNLTEISVTDDRHAGPNELAAGGRRRVELVEHLGFGAHDPRPQILKVNLPPKQVALFPRSDAAGNATGYWRPGPLSRRMVWSGRTFGGSRVMETTLRIPANVSGPVLGFWTKYGARAGNLYPAGQEFGWVQMSADNGRTWTSLPGITSSTYVAPGNDETDWVGEDLGAPAFTGDSRQYSATGWIFEQVPLPVAPGRTVRVRFNFGGTGLSNEFPSEGYGWWIDDVYLGTASNPTRQLLGDFEGDVSRWQGLLPELDRGFGFAVVEETTPFPQAYFFELRGNNAHDEVAFKDVSPKDVNGRRDDAPYTYDEGVVGYFADHYATFWAYPFLRTGSATGRHVPIERLRRAEIGYPYGPQYARASVYDLGFLLSLAQNPASGLTLDDVVFVMTLPTDQFFEASPITGLSLPVVYSFPDPSPVTLLDASPTYRPLDVSPAIPQTPFPERPFSMWPFVLGAPGGWPKSMRHGLLDLDDPTTVRVLGQPFLSRDAAFHPERTAVFDDTIDYRDRFLNEFLNWHAPTTQAAFGSTTESERVTLVQTEAVEVAPNVSIQKYAMNFCYQNPGGACVPGASEAVQRPWLEQIVYQRLVYSIYLLAAGGCPPDPDTFSLETKPLWEAVYACVGDAIEVTHQVSTQLVTVARELSNNPAYAGLNAWGDQGTLSPALWAEYYLDAWSRAKAPAPLPAAGVTLEVEQIRRGSTPVATVVVRRPAPGMTRR
jgi:hypothetical protein